MTDNEKEFIERAASSKYADYLLNKILISRISETASKFKWWIGIATTILAIVLAIFGYRQYSNLLEIDATENRVENLEEQIEKRLAEMNSEHAVKMAEYKMKQGELAMAQSAIDQQQKIASEAAKLSAHYINVSREFLTQSTDKLKDAGQKIDLVGKEIDHANSLVADFQTLTDSLRKQAYDAEKLAKLSIRVETLEKSPIRTLLYFTEASPSQAFLNWPIRINFVKRSKVEIAGGQALSAIEIKESVPVIDLIPGYRVTPVVIKSKEKFCLLKIESLKI